MATIKSQMALNDGMSAVLQKITRALDITLASFEQMQQASGQAMDTRLLEEGRGLLVGASRDFEQIAESCRKAAQEEERLNQNIHEGTSALDGMAKKALSLVGAYVSLSGVKSFAADSMSAANTQINAQRQLRTVLNNMGAPGDDLESNLTVDTSDAVSSYEALLDMADGVELGNTLTLNTTGIETTYSAFTAGIDGDTVTLAVQADTTQAISAYDDILAKASEIQGRGIYGDEAMIAGAAEFATYFSDADAILSMMDTLTDYAMGMSGGGALDTAAMVDYATGLGKIMSGSYDAMTKKGFEFTDTQKAIIEGAATEAQIVAELGAEYLNMSSDMQAAATINNVIAEGWGGLYEAMSNTPEGELIQLNNTLGDIKENVGAGIYPAVVNLVSMVRSNTPQIESMAMGVATVLGFIITVLTGMAEGAITFGTAVSDNWSWISPIVYGIIAALAIYVGYLGVTKAAELLSAGAKIAMCVASYAHAAATGTEASATAVATAAQYGFNAALLASPITWIVVGIIALTAVLYAAVGAVNHFAGTSVSATGIITGAFAVLGAHVLNGTVIPLYNGFASFINFIGNAFNDPIAAIQVAFLDMCLSVVGYIKNLAAGIENLLNKIPGVTVDITSGLDGFYAGLERAQQAVKDESGWVEYVSKMDYIDYTDAASAGYALGQGAEDKVGGFFDGLGYKPGTIEDFANQGFDSFAMDGLGGDVGEIADNTSGMAHALEISGEELKYLRDIAERDAINRFTTAEVKIDMTGMTNKIDSGMDLDGVIRKLTDGFSEALDTAAEGVHT